MHCIWNNTNYPQIKNCQELSHFKFSTRFSTREPRQVKREEYSLYNKGASTTGSPHAKEISWTPYFPPYTKISSKRIIDLNIRAKNIELLRENIRPLQPWDRQSFLRHDSKSASDKKKNSWTGFHQIFKLLCFQGYCQESEKTTHQMGKNFANHIPYKGLRFRMHKNSYKAVKKKKDK